jgi:Domain of unknown function DUF29
MAGVFPCDGAAREPILQPVMPDTATLYDTDWYAWTQDQAARLRGMPPALRPNGLDLEHLAEEVEDLGGSQRRGVVSLMREIAIHLLKVEFHPHRRSREHWKDEIAAFRTQVEAEFEASPTLRARRDELAAAAWKQAYRQIQVRQQPTAPAMLRAMQAAGVSAGRPHYETEGQLLDLEWYPPPAGD